MTTPYFVPTESIEQALVTAALRGVDVRLLVPSTTDSAVVGWASRSWFPKLLRAGARISTYSPGFIHSKIMVVDRWLGVVGSANLDARSLHLNFELNAFVYGDRFVDALADRFEVDLGRSEQVSEAEVLSPGFADRRRVVCDRPAVRRSGRVSRGQAVLGIRRSWAPTERRSP